MSDNQLEHTIIVDILPIQPIIIHAKYPIKSHRYSNDIVYVKLSATDQDEIRKHLRQYYPFNSPEQSVIRQHVQDNSCGHCLTFGHKCNPHIFPPTCPNIEYDYLAWINELLDKYEIESGILNYLVMIGVGIISSNKIYKDIKPSV